MATIFEVDAEGWRESNAGRPAAHLVRELIQNVFDEKATKLDVSVTWTAGEGARVEVTDVAPSLVVLTIGVTLPPYVPVAGRLLITGVSVAGAISNDCTGPSAAV